MANASENLSKLTNAELEQVTGGTAQVPVEVEKSVEGSWEPVAAVAEDGEGTATFCDPRLR